MIRYIFGSEDSTDLDVLYIADKIPSFTECQEFCSNKEENRNIATIENEVISSVFKGTVDELNNCLLTTYSLHEQTHPLTIENYLERDILIKYVRVIRCILSHCSRTKYRSRVKFALKSYSLNDKIKVLKEIDFKSLIDYGDKNDIVKIYKIFAFQLGQCLGLHQGDELYTKSSISNIFPKLRPFLYREKEINVDDLIFYINKFINILDNLEYKLKGNFTYFVAFDKPIDLKNEKYKED